MGPKGPRASGRSIDRRTTLPTAVARASDDLTVDGHVLAVLTAWWCALDGTNILEGAWPQMCFLQCVLDSVKSLR